MNDRQAMAWRRRLHLQVLLVMAAGTMLGGCTTRAGEAKRITTASDAAAIVVSTDAGQVKGVRSIQGRVFLGIPYAASPVGERRFAPPQDAESWVGIRDARVPGPTCPQATGPDRSEDCLNLNVYAPADMTAGERLPVMVWLYGGGLTFGSNRQYDGSFLAARQRMVVVVPNYRLGAFGFFAHPALRGPGEGNFGLLDQQAALRWVRRNIAGFGGDPARVTLFGESAGATSACTHMVMPGSRGLFQRVILQSDTCIFPDQWSHRADAERGGLEMAGELGCADLESALDCLRALPVKRLRKAKSRRWGNGGKDSWSPMVGGDVLPDTQRALFERGAAAPVPLIMGSNRDEGRLFANALAITLSWASDRGYRRALDRAVRPAIRQRVEVEYRDVAARSRYRAAADILTDSRFACPMLTLHRLRGPHAATWVYEFDDPDAPRAIPTVPFAPAQRAYHASELIYIFQHPLLFASPRAWTLAQRALAGRMQDHWGAFARSGDPNVSELPTWPKFDGERPLRLSPDGAGDTDDFARRHRCAFWNAIGY